jgi:hypothetical protein
MARKSKKEKFYEEREEILNKILKILELDENRSFTLYELDNNKEKQEKILEMKTEIAKYFITGNIFAYKKQNCKRPYMGIIRGIFKQQDYTVGYKTCGVKIDGETKITDKYFILRDKMGE